MCGRYYVDNETAKEIEKIIRDLDWKLKLERIGNIKPFQRTGVIRGSGEHLIMNQMSWGFPRFDGKGLLINTRSESVL